MKVKDDLHLLIDMLDDEQLLKSYYSLLESMSSQKTGELWNKLSETEKEELLISYNESFNSKNLIPHSEVKQQHAKWIEK